MWRGYEEKLTEEQNILKLRQRRLSRSDRMKIQEKKRGDKNRSRGRIIREIVVNVPE